MLHAHLACPKIPLRFTHLLVCLCIRTYRVLNDYITYIVAIQLHFGGLEYWCSYYEKSSTVTRSRC